MKKKKNIKSQKTEKVKVSEKPSPETELENRRVFLKKIWKGLGVLAAIEFAGVFLGFLF